MHSRYESAKCNIESGNKSWTIEDEQCQKTGGGYAAVKLRFLLFLWVEPTFIYVDLESSVVIAPSLSVRIPPASAATLEQAG
jgi:hypothetical protein